MCSKKYMLNNSRVQLKGRLQLAGENLQHFEADILRLVRLAYPTAPPEFLEQLSIQHFIDGLRYSETQQALRQGRHRTLNDALSHALEFEAAKVASRGHVKVRRVPAVDEAPGQDDVWEQLIEFIGKLRAASKSGENLQAEAEPRSRLPRCWNCGKTGHLRNQCRSVPKGNKHGNADALSRRPCPTNGKHCSSLERREDTSTIPCKVVTAQPEDKWRPAAIEAGTGRPPWPDVNDKGVALKSYWAQWDSLAVEDGTLVRNWENSEGIEVKKQVLLPRSRVPEVLQEVHAGIGGGHIGTNKTLQKLRDRFYWRHTDPDTYVGELERRMSAVHDHVRSRLQLESDRMKTRYDVRANSSGFQEGDLVWLYNPVRRKGRSPKLQNNWEGPFTVIKRINDGVYRIQRNPRNKIYEVCKLSNKADNVAPDLATLRRRDLEGRKITWKIEFCSLSVNSLVTCNNNVDRFQSGLLTRLGRAPNASENFLPRHASLTVTIGPIRRKERFSASKFLWGFTQALPSKIDQVLELLLICEEDFVPLKRSVATKELFASFKPYALVDVGEELNFLELVGFEMEILFGYLAD
ncbi:hypothetical protein NQ318_012128 [Aromia moschata]|uniref:RNA-directed DNA polymerase n=1 Tax=Aromia moschata TaxID=1265417 RepID=A0AAV8YQW4_9CUCU|nr:hypothetical protein NQ318_012128 [Aromia moschata]